MRISERYDYHFDKDGSRHLASASTRCKTCVSNARLTLLPDCQRTWPGHNAKPFQSVCARHSESSWWLATVFWSKARRCEVGIKPMSIVATQRQESVVGLSGLEPPASPLSGVRSNHLSYRPKVSRFSREVRTWRCGLLRREPHVWWSLSGSNRRPPACKAGALPAELWPRVCDGTRHPNLGSRSLNAGHLCGRLAMRCHSLKRR